MDITRSGQPAIHKHTNTSKVPQQKPVEAQPATDAQAPLPSDTTSTILPGLEQLGTMLPLNLQAQANNKPDRLTLQIQKLAQDNLPKEDQQLAKQLSNLDPSSPEAIQVTTQIFSRWTGSQKDLETFGQLNALKQLKGLATTLKSSMANLDPSSPETQQLQARLDSLNDLRKSISNTIKMQDPAQNRIMTQQLRQQLAKAKPGSTEAQHLQARLYTLANIRHNDNITNKMQQLAQDGLPLKALQQQLANAEPGSTEAKQIQDKIDFIQEFLKNGIQSDSNGVEAAQKNMRLAALWAGSPQDLQKYQLLSAKRQVNTLAAHVNTMIANLDPNSPEAQQMHTQLDAIRTQRKNLNKQLDQLDKSNNQSSETLRPSNTPLVY
jgi:tetrahydromethanopterin S-methyltransferase subunit B